MERAFRLAGGVDVFLGLHPRLGWNAPLVLQFDTLVPVSLLFRLALVPPRTLGVLRTTGPTPSQPGPAAQVPGHTFAQGLKARSIRELATGPTNQLLRALNQTLGNPGYHLIRHADLRIGALAEHVALIVDVIDHHKAAIRS